MKILVKSETSVKMKILLTKENFGKNENFGKK